MACNDLAVACEDARFDISGVGVGPFSDVSLPAARIVESALESRVLAREALDDTAVEAARTLADKSPADLDTDGRALYQQAAIRLEEVHADAGGVMADSMVARGAEAGIGVLLRRARMQASTGE